MKNIFFILILLMFYRHAFGAMARISGKIVHTTCPVGMIHFSQVERGIPNLEGFRDKPFDIINGEFRVDITGFTSGDHFVLTIGHFNLRLLLYDKDKLDIDIKENQNFVFEVMIKGKGSERNNCFHIINNTKYKVDDFRGLSSEERKKIIKDNFIQNKAILNFAYTKKEIPSKVYLDSLTVERIKRLGKHISLNEEEFKYLNEYISLLYYNGLMSLANDFDSLTIMQSLESFFEYSKMKALVRSSKRFECSYRSSFILDFLRFYIKKGIC